jgi:hypothetical protein
LCAFVRFGAYSCSWGLCCWLGGFIVGSYTLIIGHVHAAASGVALLVAFVVLLALFGGGKSGGSSGK